jgi:hypothetical protein
MEAQPGAVDAHPRDADGHTGTMELGKLTLETWMTIADKEIFIYIYKYNIILYIQCIYSYISTHFC